MAIQERHAITSLRVAKDGRHVLVNLTSKIINLWDIHTLQIVQSYAGHTQARLAIHSCFVGPNQSFIASGSEGGGYRGDQAACS